MVNLSAEQQSFLQKLSVWASSDECKQTVFNRVCSALQNLIDKKKKTSKFDDFFE